MINFTIDHIADPAHLAKLAKALIPVMDAAGDAIMAVKDASKTGGHKKGVAANEKSDGSPVTVADGLKTISAPLSPRQRAPSGKCRS